MWACDDTVGSEVCGYNSFVPAACLHIPSLRGENMGAKDWERTEGEEALKITILPSSLHGARFLHISQLSATLPFFPLPRYLLIFFLGRREYGRCWGGRWRSLPSLVSFLFPFSLDSSQTTWQHHQPFGESKEKTEGENCGDEGQRERWALGSRGERHNSESSRWETRSWAGKSLAVMREGKPH